MPLGSAISFEVLAEQLQLAEELRLQRSSMFAPQDLPGRYGRVVGAIDRVLAAMQCPALLAGGWAVWRHGYLGRVTQDVDIVLPAERIDEFLQVAGVSGFEKITPPAGRWPKLLHKDTGIQVDILPEGARPGSSSAPAPTTIRSPEEMGAVRGTLAYLGLAETIELKLAAGRQRDLADVVELIRSNPDKIAHAREHLARIHASYVSKFDRCTAEAQQQQDQ
jgi:hypothetical protein